MLPLVTFALLLVAHVNADNYRGSPRIWRRETGVRNSTNSFSNSTTSSITSSVTSSIRTPTVTIPIAFPSSNDTSVTKLLPILSPSFTLNSTTFTTPGATCAGSVTYTGSVYPTVFLTVTEGFDVTVSASNASITESATLVTPLPACTATVVSASGVRTPDILSGAAPVATIAVSTISVVIESTISAPAETTTTFGANPKGKPHPLNPSEANTPDGAGGQTEAGALLVTQLTSVSVVYSTMYASSEYSSAAYTSTVIITKKTPVPVVVPPTSNPPVFQNPAPTKSADAPGTSHQNVPVAGVSSKDSLSTAPSPKANGGGGGPIITTVPDTSTGIPNNIISGPNPALAPPQAATINSVPISLGASSIVVGTQTIAIPTTGAATVRAGGQLFTVKASEIIASGTTLEFGALEQAQQTASVAPTRITAVPGVVITVQGTTAVVAGTTYRIGEGASSTVLTVSGQKIQLGASGVILASTTIPALVVTAAPKVVETVGSLTFSVGASNVVLDGTTYRIGSGAPTIRTTVDGQSLSIGPGGVGVGSKTTLKPMTVTTLPTATGAASASLATQTGAADSTFVARMPLAEALGLLLMAIAGIVS